MARSTAAGIALIVPLFVCIVAVSGFYEPAQALQRKSALAPSQVRDDAYWVEMGTRVLDYMAERAGADYTEQLRDGFVTWLERSPEVLRQYEDGDDMNRKAIVDQYLKRVLPHVRDRP